MGAVAQLNLICDTLATQIAPHDVDNWFLLLWGILTLYCETVQIKEDRHGQVANQYNSNISFQISLPDTTWFCTAETESFKIELKKIK